ncbi:MAG: hypothetical protein HY526_08240 [Betaproteobacteria bacterium]|nr:hypothetical protein [Betaproteobacteria bacterium]
MVFNWLTGGRPDHPLADMKRARELVTALPQHDSVRALEDVAAWLESLNSEAGFKLRNRLELVDLLDQAAKTHWHKIAPEYLEAPRLQKFYEKRLWEISFGFWKTLGDAYLQCIEQFQAGGSGAGATEKGLPLVTGRALRCLGVQLKWLLLRYDLIEERIWRDLGRAYLFAESRGFADQRTAIYPGKHGESSAREEFLKTLMLMMSAPEGLAPAKLQIAERMVAHFGSGFVLDRVSGPGRKFFFDLSMHRPPGRVHKGLRAGSMLRFFGPGPVEQALSAMANLIHERDGIPSDVNLGGNFDNETVLSVLAHLERYWGDQPPARTAERRDIATRVTVVPDFSKILPWIEALADASSLEFSDPEAAESWIAFNTSKTGLGAIVPTVRADWVRIGRLLGLRTETSSICRIGVVRRATRDPYEQRRVGIEVLGDVTIPVKVAAADGAGSPNVEGSTAFLLASKPDKNREVAIVMRAGSFTRNHNMQMRVRDKAYLLAPSELIEAGGDYDWARFEVVKQL